MPGPSSSYTEEQADYICNELAVGRSLQSICREPGMPASRTVYQWTDRFPEFRERFENARKFQGWSLADKAVDLAHGEFDCPKAAHVQLNAIKWAAARLAPKQYGDRLDVNHGGQADNPVQIVVQRFTDDQPATDQGSA